MYEYHWQMYLEGSKSYQIDSPQLQVELSLMNAKLLWTFGFDETLEPEIDFCHFVESLRYFNKSYLCLYVSNDSLV